MQLVGRLEHTSVLEVIHALLSEKATGILELGAGGTQPKHRVHVHEGEIYEVETYLSRSRLGELLVAAGQLDPKVLRRLLSERLGWGSLRLGEVLVQQKWVPLDSVRAALKQQLRQRISALSELKTGSLRFHTGVARKPAKVRNSLSSEDLPAAPAWRAGFMEPRRQAPPPPNLSFAERLRQREAYRELGLAEGANPERVRQAFRTLAKHLHPDANPGATLPERAELRRRFAALSQAYHVLIK